MIRLQDGNHQKKIDYRPAVDTPAGSVVLFGTTITITSVDILAGADAPSGAVNWPNAGAQYSMPNPNGLAFAAGDDVFVDATDPANPFALASGGAGKIGVATRDVAAGDDVWFVHER